MIANDPATFALVLSTMACAVALGFLGKGRLIIAVVALDVIAPGIGSGEWHVIVIAAAMISQIGITAATAWRVAPAILSWIAAHKQAISLQPPFEGTWSVAIGGPFPGRNHHVRASDQRYACDLTAVGAPSRGKPILSPCDGVIVTATDAVDDAPDSFRVIEPERGDELGNHVVIKPDGSDAHIFLCHLLRGSIVVQAGQHVAAGEMLGCCGNSGRTSRAHLHLHAQREPAYALNAATGIPVKFVDRRGRARIPWPGQRLSRSGASYG